MSHPNHQVRIPIVNFQNVVVTVTEDSNGGLSVSCVQGIPCNTRNTLINFQIPQRRTKTCDYQFTDPDVSDPDDQLTYMISRDGKMLTLCDLDSSAKKISFILNVVDVENPYKVGRLDPEVANQPDGTW